MSGQAPGGLVVAWHGLRTFGLSRNPRAMWLVWRYSSCKGKMPYLQEDVLLVPPNRASRRTLKHAKCLPSALPD